MYGQWKGDVQMMYRRYTDRIQTILTMFGGCSAMNHSLTVLHESLMKVSWWNERNRMWRAASGRSIRVVLAMFARFGIRLSIRTNSAECGRDYLWSYLFAWTEFQWKSPFYRLSAATSAARCSWEGSEEKAEDLEPDELEPSELEASKLEESKEPEEAKKSEGICLKHLKEIAYFSIDAHRTYCYNLLQASRRFSASLIRAISAISSGFTCIHTACSRFSRKDAPYLVCGFRAMEVPDYPLDYYPAKINFHQFRCLKIIHVIL